MAPAATYLVVSLCLLAVSLTGMALAPRHRKAMALSGLLSAPGALYALLFVPAYWQPSRVLDTAIGIEDVIFSFANGGIVWLLASGLSGRRVVIEPCAARLFWRYSSRVVLFTGVWLILLRAGSSVMDGGLLAGVALIATVRPHRTLCLRLGAAGAASFGLAYGGLVVGVLSLYPHAIHAWNTANLWGVVVLGVPLEELVWAVAFGGVWPMFMAFVLDARFADPALPPTPLDAVNSS